MAIIDNIRRYMLAANLNQTTLAKKAKVDLKSMSRIMNGKQAPTLGTLFKLARTLGVTVEALQNTETTREKVVRMPHPDFGAEPDDERDSTIAMIDSIILRFDMERLRMVRDYVSVLQRQPSQQKERENNLNSGKHFS